MEKKKENAAVMTIDPGTPSDGAAEYVYMPKADYVGGLDAIRAKGGATGPILSGDLAAAVEAIPSGGGMEVTEVVVDQEIRNAKQLADYLLGKGFPSNDCFSVVFRKDVLTYPVGTDNAFLTAVRANKEAIGYDPSGNGTRSAPNMNFNWGNQNYDVILHIGEIIEIAKFTKAV